MIFARSRIEFDAAPVGLNAPPLPLKVRPTKASLVPAHGPAAPAESPAAGPTERPSHRAPAGRQRTQGRFAATVLSAAVIVMAGAVWIPTTAQASEPITSFTTTMSTAQAGGHPDLTTSFALEDPGSPEAARNVLFNAPTGVFGNPRAASECAAVDFALEQCPPNSQVGLITLHANYNPNPDFLLGTAPVFAEVPSEGETARFAFIAPTLNIPIAIPITVRSASDYGLRFTVSDITQLAPLSSAQLTFWGFPADESHNAERFAKGELGHPAGCPGEAGTGCIATPTEASIPVEPLTDNPTICTGQEPTSSLEVQTYQDPAHPSEAHATYPPIEGCEAEKFEPFLRASPTTTATDSASGLNLDLSAPQFESRAASPSEIKSATVTLPEGFTINPDAADGQAACTEAQAGFGSEGPANCPDSSKIGTFQIATPALPERLEGALYIGQPEIGNQYRLFMIASGSGINAKLLGSLRPDPQTGRLSAEFPDLPQAPFEDFQLHLFGGERSLLATPNQCSVYAVSARFTPWNSALAPQTSNQNIGLGSGPGGASCPGQVRPFHPTLEAGTSNPTAGAHSAFTLKLDREDGDQFLGKLNFTMPPGLSADLHGVAYCSEADIASAANTPGRTEQATPSCPASSEIGASNVAAGPGTHPFHATGKVYFAGPFQGAPLSLVAITPALAGPYDYGTVVVRVALHIDPLDAHVIADSETMPEVIGGVPLRLRSVQVSIDRSDFMINPTNCAPMSIGSEGVGDQGTPAAFSSYFDAVNCSTLPFKPKLSIIQLGGHKSTRRNSDPALRFDLRTRPGDANLKSLALTLPNAFEIAQAHLGNLCSKAELETTHCTGRQPIGVVKDETPLLEKPLQGLAYAVSGYGGLPHVASILNGQVTVIPQGESVQTKRGLRTEVPVIPDVPIGHFQLTLFGGNKDYIANTRSLCAAPTLSTVQFKGQNGKSLQQRVKTKTACGATKRTKRHRH